MSPSSPSPPSSPAQNNINNNNNYKYKSLPSNAKIGIIGGGISGLSTAISLQKYGYTNVTIYERDLSTLKKSDGYGLTISYNDSPKNSCLVQLDILNDLLEYNTISTSHYVFRHDGVILDYYGHFNNNNKTSRQNNHINDTTNTKVGNIRIQRPILKKIMINKLNSNTIKYNKKLISLECNYNDYDDNLKQKNNDNIKVKNNNLPRICASFEDNTKEYFDLVIGADGIRSSTLSQYYKLLNTIQQQKQLNKKLSSSKKLSACTTTKLNNNNNNLNNDAITHLSNNSDVIINDSKRSLVTNISNTNDHSMQEENKLTYLKIFLILGITSYKHSFLTKRGFYTLDGTSRMFTMPFDDNRTMWQLSFRLEDENKAKELQKSCSSTKLNMALSKCKKWHTPCQEMIKHTLIDTIWGTALVDKIPKSLHPCSQQGNNSNKPFLPIVVIGDAMHPMSPFKGQGANTALNDGVILTSYLQKSSTLYKALSNFERVRVVKGTTNVLLSRNAASYLHSNDVLMKKKKKNNARKKLCIRDACSKEKCFDNLDFLSMLEEKDITASLGGRLDDSISNAIDDFFNDNVDDEKKNEE